MATATAAEHIGAYVIEQELGRGAHGIVYRAHHRDRPDTPVALKVVDARGDVDRLLIEPAVLSRLNHPGIVRLRDYFVDGDRLVLALEFIEGEELKALLDRGDKFTQGDVRDFLVQMASALTQAHARNVVHRDLKPSNILVVHEGKARRYVLTDFGIGQLAGGIQREKHTGGTFLFMAPEQLRGRPGPQSDLWALGVVAYRMLTGRLPFPGPTIGELTKQILYAAPVPPGEGRAEPLDPKLERVVLKLLDKSLEERVGSAEELLRLLGHRGAADRTPPPSTRPTVVKVGTSLDRQLRRGIRNRAALLVLCIVCWLIPGGLGAAVLMLVGMWLFYRAQGSTRWSAPAVFAGTVGALCLWAGSLGLRYLASGWDITLGNVAVAVATHGQAVAGWLIAVLGPELANVVGIALAVLAVVLYLVYVFLPVIAAALYSTMRRLQRELVLRNAALESGTGSDRYLRALRDALDSRFEDVGLHLKYAEALFARGKVKHAAVEARILLRQDPYNFGGNLLLANAYLTLGLVAECDAVCDRYLAVSGYCFEFSELREQCQRRLSRP